MIKRVVGVYFSPTGSTAKQVRAVSERIGKALALAVDYKDITPYSSRQVAPFRFRDDELVVVGFPTYAGRLPNKIAPDVPHLLVGANTPLVALVTFGNRAFDNSLAELVNLLETNSFRTVGAIALPCKHVFAQIGSDQPTPQTEAAITALVDAVIKHINTTGVKADAVVVPGEAKAPYYVPKGVDGNPLNFLKAKPHTDESKCNACGLCASLCPMRAISFKNPTVIEGTCIKCHSCVARCPQGAKFFDDAQFLSHKQYLEQNHNAPTETKHFE